MNGITRPALHEILRRRRSPLAPTYATGVTVTEILQRPDGVDVTFTDGRRQLRPPDRRGRPALARSASMLFGGCGQAAATPDRSAAATTSRGSRASTASEVYIGGEAGTAGFVPLSDELMYMLFIEKPPERSRDRLRARLRDGDRGRLGRSAARSPRQRERITDDGAVVYRPVENIVMPAPWYRGRALLIGDAAHAHVAARGQGAAQAIEDARRPRRGDRGRQDSGRDLETFMARRYERCKQVVEGSEAISALGAGGRARCRLRRRHRPRRDGRRRAAVSVPRRVVTGHDAQGRSVVLSDGPTPRSHENGAAIFHELWNTRRCPRRSRRPSASRPSGRWSRRPTRTARSSASR